jgi:hypothetical protein
MLVYSPPCGLYSVIKAHGTIGWRFIGGTAFAASGVGYFASIITRPNNAAVVNVIGQRHRVCVSGIEPPLTAVSNLPVINWLWYLSYGTWVAEGTYVTFAKRCCRSSEFRTARTFTGSKLLPFHDPLAVSLELGSCGGH